ncbi:MAG: nuclease-related domain-containing protein [Acidimicrobiales bacterium]|jgi:hypothetical protein
MPEEPALEDSGGLTGTDVSVVDAETAGKPRAARAGALQPSRKWVKRAEGDRRAITRLQLVESQGLIVLNDRRIPGSKSSIKLIAISPAGVFVIDAKSYKGLVHTKRPGPIQSLGPMELHVGRRNCTPTVEGLAGQVEVVRAAVSSAPWGSEVPVHALLCLTRAEWGFASPIEISDVWVGWPRLMVGRLQAPEVMDSPTVQEVSEMISERLP